MLVFGETSPREQYMNLFSIAYDPNISGSSSGQLKKQMGCKHTDYKRKLLTYKAYKYALVAN